MYKKKLNEKALHLNISFQELKSIEFLQFIFNTLTSKASIISQKGKVVEIEKLDGFVIIGEEVEST